MSSLSSLDSKPIINCQICASNQLESVLFLGYVPPVNSMPSIEDAPTTELRFPLEMLQCKNCGLAQIGYEVDQRILFPHSYPYLSGSTRILRDNFKELANETCKVLDMQAQDLVIDIGANDGTLLKPYKELNFNVLGIEPSQAADVGMSQGIPMLKTYFNESSAKEAVQQYGHAKVVTAANVFAHIANVHEIVEAIKILMRPEGLFISESHYLLPLIETLQYDTIYHEHLRYYSLNALIKLFEAHDMEVIRVKQIPTHGGSIRVYTARKGTYPVDTSVHEQLALEAKAGITDGSALRDFNSRVKKSKIDLLRLVCELKQAGAKIYGVGAPSRASTLINYVGLDETLVDCVMEISSSHKINKFIPGTRVPVLDEAKLYEDQPEFALFYSWHIANELADIIRGKGFKGKFIVPLPTPKIFE